MKKIITSILLLTSLYCISFSTANAQEETSQKASPTIPVTMFKAQVVPCECPPKKPNNGYFYSQTDLLQKAIKYAFCTDDLSKAMAQMNNDCDYYYAQNNTSIKDGSFDIYKLFLLKKFCNAEKIRITITLASDGYSEADKKPELYFGLYKNISQCELSKRFTSRAFLHHYLMRKYEIPVRMTMKDYHKGIQQFVATVDARTIKEDNEGIPLFGVVTYMKSGFKASMKRCNADRTHKIYGYLIKIERLS